MTTVCQLVAPQVCKLETRHTTSNGCCCMLEVAGVPSTAIERAQNKRILKSTLIHQRFVRSESRFACEAGSMRSEKPGTYDASGLKYLV
jgi:hypothetical protein